MAEKHPDELKLLAFVEEELDGETRRTVAEHLVTCGSCANQIRRLETGRDALRTALVLELPAGRREEIVRSLPERRDPWRLFRPAKRALVIAVPVAAAAAVVGVFALGGTQIGGGGDADDAAGGAAEEATVMDEAEAGNAESQLAVPGATLVRSVQGPPTAVVRRLEDEGIPAEVDAPGRVIAQARIGEVRAALAGRPAGDVAVYVR